MSEYESWASFAQTWGTVSFVVFFVLVLLYALNPGNRDRFNQAARTPLEKD